MIVYAESSAALAWLLGEPRGVEVASALRGAAQILVSELLYVECDRACIRAAAAGALTDEQAALVRLQLARTSAHWQVLRITTSVLERSRQPFPHEPVRTLDAVHLASALEARSALPETCVLSLDARVRQNAAKLGFEVIPR
jgi:hypothetical protein